MRVRRQPEGAEGWCGVSAQPVKSSQGDSAPRSAPKSKVAQKKTAKKAAPQQPQQQPLYTSELLLTVDQAARKLGIGKSLMYKLIWDGDVASLTIGRFRRVAVAELARYIEARTDAERSQLLGRSA